MRGDATAEPDITAVARGNEATPSHVFLHAAATALFWPRRGGLSVFIVLVEESASHVKLSSLARGLCCTRTQQKEYSGPRWK